ncbi:TraR/DksA C4-type zinc finger protein [Microbacterium sp. zg.Y1090]|uniref:TraR/DksA family transcriptional regulator n=1 Tax=Microbacterium TaxID=33882 RepID=UPI00214AC52E|nr:MULTISPECIES: TraR/DksA C4-type zinc finger protein [unclassified Microbacterium]MCR2811478.1 TraR/DksA C4-type zinc finger protein [Microbacterium sp. zg.Y1084]MCR2819103.1 TraR/DksA C4-type zinc finger protein [Microbacterium sp. zg.Y1090]MDL5487898.1 TraR/DksA C4-type zinc finger protein [Microbacterium sp. zg-Y1211]WIM27406.1 TraR/DksA C4-type zinc finger protein [Microbacterium sp. zg-Y1090]
MSDRAADIAALASVIERRRADVEVRLARLDGDDALLRRDRADGTADDEHDPEGSTLSGEWAQIDALRRAAVAERDRLDAARERLAAHTYGACVSCGRPIPIERLQARPEADRCVSCASAAGA